jgi:VWFA-related protein
MLRLFKCLLGPALSALAFAPLAAAQTPQPTQQSTQTAPAQQPSNPAVTTLHSGAQLVVVDVVVTDSQQNAVHNLKASDFTLLEKNVPQQIKNFEEHKALPAAEAAKLQPLPPMPPGVFTNYSPVPLSGTLNVLLLDTLNTPIKDQMYVREQLHKYLKGASPANRIAIFGLSSRLVLLQGFTSNPELLKAAINQKNYKASPLLDDAVGGGGGLEPLSDSLSNFGSDPDMAGVIASLQQFEAEQQSFQLQLRARYTLDAFNQIARYLTGIPGRKNLIWFSGSFPINILPDGDLQNPFAVVASAEDEFRETTNMLTASQVAVYPIDARGLMTSPNLSAANSGSKYARSATRFGKDETKFLQQTGDEHATMLQIAEQTGGRAFINTNDLTDAVAKSIEAGSSYYTLYYSPSNTNWNGDFRKIQVKLQQQGLTLAYRRGYYADSPSASLKKGSIPATTSANSPPPLDVMRVAMTRGGPDPTQILIKVRVIPATAAPEDQLAPKNVLNPAHKTTGPYRRYAIDYAADAHDVLFATSSDGTYRGGLQFATYVYDGDGNLINLTEDKVKANITPTAYADLLHHGILWRQDISVPVKGDFYLRIGLHDLIGDRVGAIEVPVAKVKNLPPAQK